MYIASARAQFKINTHRCWNWHHVHSRQVVSCPVQPRARHWSCVFWRDFSGVKRTCWTTGSWRSCLSLEVVSSIPAWSTIIYRFLCGFICVSLCQSIKIKPTNMYIASARAQFKINTHRCWNWHHVHSRQVVSCPVQPRARHWSCVFWRDFSGVKRTCWTTGSWRSCLSLEVVSSIPAWSTIIYRFLCGFICVSLCQSIKIKPTNMYIASARAQFKINTHRCWNWHHVHSRQVVSCPVQPRARHWSCVFWRDFSGVKRTCWTTGSWRSCLSLEVVSSIPAWSTIIYRFLCGFICVSLCQSIKIKPTNMYIASARAQFKINTHRCWNWHHVHSRQVVSCPVQPRARHWSCVFWRDFSGVKRTCWTTGSWRSCLSLEVVSSIPAWSTIIYRFLCGFICVSLCQSIKIKPTNMYIASARAQFKINTHRCWNWHHVHSRQVVSCPVQPRARHWSCVFWRDFSGVKRTCWTTGSWRSCLSLEVVSSIPAWSTIIYRFLCGFICVSLCQSIKIKPTNMYIASARAQFKINTHRCWNWHHVHSRQVVSCPVQPRARHWSCVFWRDFSGVKRTCWTTGSWRSCLSLEVVSSIPAWSTIIYRFLCGFICVSLCQSIKIKPTNMYIASARAQFKINTHRCWNWHHVHSRQVVSCPVQPRARHWSCVFWRDFSGVKRTCWTTGSWRSCLSLEVVSSIPAWSTIIYRLLCGFICVSLCQSIKIKPTNMYIASARAQFKINTHRCWNWHHVHSRQVVSCPVQPRARHWSCVFWRDFSGVKRTCWTTGSWRSCLSLEVVSSIPAWSTIIYRFLCGFICVSLCQSIKIKPTNIYYTYLYLFHAGIDKARNETKH